MNDFRKLFEQTSTVETQNEGTSFRAKFDQAQAMSNAGDINGIMSLVSANISDPEEAQAVAGMTYTLAKTYNQKPIDILKDLDGWAARYNGATQPRKTAWKQIQDGFVSGWYTDQLGTIGSALMYDQKPEIRQMYLDKIAEIRARMPNPEGDKGNIGVKALSSASNLVGTMVRPFLTNLAVSSLIPAIKLPMVATELAGAVPAIAKKVASHAVSFGTTWAVTADVEAGNIYIDMLDNGVDEDIARKYARIHGAIAGALEAAPLEFAFTRFPFLKGATQSAWKNLATNTRAKQAMVKALGGILQKNLISAPMQVLAETATEALQEVSSISFEKRAALALADEVKDEKLKKMLPEVYSQWRDLYNKEVGDRQVLYEGKDYKEYVADRVWDVVVQTALGTSVLGFAGAAGQVISDARYTSTLRKEAEVDPSKFHFIKKHFTDEQMKDIKPGERKETLAQIYDTHHAGEATVDNINPKTIDADYVPINEDVEDEEQAQASSTPTQPIKRRKDNRLHTQEMIGNDKNPGVIRHSDGSESHTLLLGTTDTSARKNNRYGYIDYTISADGRSVKLDSVNMKPGYEDLTGEFVTELMRRYPGLEIEWSPEADSQKAIKEQLIKGNTENPGKLQMFKRDQSDMDRILKVAGYIKEIAPKMDSDKAAVFAEVLDIRARRKGVSLDEYLGHYLKFMSVEQGIKEGRFTEQELKDIKGKKGAFKPMIDAVEGIVFVGEEGDFSTFAHETWHGAVVADPESAKEFADAIKNGIAKNQKGFRKYLSDHATIMAGSGVLTPDNKLDIDRAISELSNMDADPTKWNTAQNELSARLFETALQEGRTFDPEMKSIMDKIVDFFLKIYRLLKQRSMLNDDIVKAMDKIFLGNPELKAKAEATQTQRQETSFQEPTPEERAEADRQYNEVVAKYKGTSEWLKAPNGQPTKLTERQWVQVRTPLFKAWFGDWENDPQNASKVVDENGEPLVVYHGTDKFFDTFSTKKTATPQFWFTSSRELIEKGEVGAAGKGTIIPVFLDIKNPAGWKQEDNLGLQQIIDRGYDGKVLEDAGETTYVAFEPTQIKSATDNVGTFSQSNPSILFQTNTGTQLHDIGGTLVVTHNLTEDNLKGAIEIGGMPMPSLAVTRPDINIDYFGDITLVGDKALAEQLMRRGEIFDRDMWSPVVPMPEYKVDKKALDKFDNWLISIKVDGLHYLTTDNLSKYQKDNPKALSEYLSGEDFVRLEYCKEKGIKVDIPFENRKYADDERLYAAAKKWQDENKKIWLDKEGDAEAFAKYLEPVVSQIISETKDQDLIDFYKEEYSAENKRGLENFLYSAREYKPNDKVVNTTELRKKLDELAKREDVAKWLVDTKFDFFSEPFLTISRKKVPYNAENIFRIMARTPKVGNQMGAITFSNALTASYSARELRSRKAIAEKESLLSDIKEKDFEDTFREYHDVAIRAYKYSDTWSALDDSNKVIAQYLKSNNKTDENLKRIFESLDFTVNDVLLEEAKNLIEYIETAPRKYFEAKPRRVMQLSDFKYAIVPSDASESTINTLKDNGVDVVVSDNRQEALTNLTNSHSNLLFQSAYHGSGASFEKFDTAFMGTGEGAQAFGWGIYLTQSEGIARSYAEEMGSRKHGYYGYYGNYEFLSDGKPIAKEAEEILGKFNFIREAESGNQSRVREKIKEIIEQSKEEIEDKEKEIQFFLDEIIKIESDPSMTLGEYIKNAPSYEEIGYNLDNFTETVMWESSEREKMPAQKMADYLESINSLAQDRIDALTERINILSDLDLDKVTIEKDVKHRNLYTVSIPDDNGSNYLYWDRPVTKEQAEKIVRAEYTKYDTATDEEKETLLNLTYLDRTGEEVYRELEKKLAKKQAEGTLTIVSDSGTVDVAPKAASELLSRAGYVGIDYPANSLSGGNKYGKRNFVIFNADDITIDTHTMWQEKTPQEIENEQIAEAKGQTLDDWLDYNRFMGDEDIDEEALKAIWEKANNVTETPEGTKIVNTENLTEEEKDNAFQAIIDSEDGVRRVIEDIRQAIQFKNEVQNTGASDEEEQYRTEAIRDAQADLETTAAKIIKSVVFSKEKEIDEQAVKSIQGIMRKNLAEYRELYSKFTGREELAMSNDALPFIDEPTRAAVATMTISQKRKYLEEVADEKLTESFLKGKELREGETEKVIKHLKEKLADKDKDIAEAQAELKNATKRISSRDQMLLKEVGKREELENQVNKLSAKIRAKLDKGNKISEEEYRKLNTAQEKLDNINEMLKELRKQDKAKEALRWSEKIEKLNAERKWNEKRLRAAQKLHEYKRKLSDYIMRKVSKNVNWEQAEQIKAIQADFGTTTGYDSEFITLRGKRMNLTEFREGVKNGTISIEGLTDYQKNRLYNLSLADYTVEDLEYLAETVRYLTQKGRQEWQAKVDARNYEAKQWQTLIMNQIARSPRYANASDTPLPGTAEDIKKERNILQMIRTGWFKTLNMARKAQMLDGDRKAVAYRLLVEEYRDHLRNELEAIRRRQKPVQDLMEKLGVKPEDFYNDTYRLNIGGHEQTYNLSQIIYGVKAQMEQRNMEAFVYGNLFNANEKPEGVNRLWLEKQGETRLAEFNRQAQEILKDKENIMKVADAIWADWQNRDNFNRLNQAAIDEYNQAVDPVAFYMPIARLDFNGTELASKIADDLYNQNAGKGMTSVEKGMIKSRITIAPENQMPIDMDYFKLWNESVNDQEHFIETNAYIRKLNRVFKARGSKDLKATIENVFGQGMMNDINNYINEIANPDTNTDTQGVNKFITFLRGALYPAYLAFKASSVILQMITSPAPFLREVGPLELVKGLVQMSLHPVETWRYVSGLSAIMESRSMNPMVEEAKKAAQRYTDPKYKRLWHKIQEKGTMGLEMADKWSVTAGWLAVFTKQKDKLIAEGMEEAQAEREAVKYADNVVLETQPTGDKAELAPLFKVGGPAWQAFTQFQVSLNVIWNNLSYDVLFSDRINHEKRKAMGTLIGYAMAGMILYATQEGFDDDDDAEDVILKLLYGATTQYTSSIPLVSSSIDNMIRARMTGENWISKSNQLYPGFDALMQGVTNLDWKKVVRGAAIMGGVPMSGWKEFEHSFYNRKTGELRFYPQAFLGRRETNKKK